MGGCSHRGRMMAAATALSARGGEKHSEFYYFSQRIGWDFLVSSQKGKDVSRVFKGEEMLTRQKREGGTSRHDRQTDRQTAWSVKGPGELRRSQKRYDRSLGSGSRVRHWGAIRPGRWSVASWDVRALPSGARETRRTVESKG